MTAGKSYPEDLTSWKEIAEYLGVSVRTAQNWERERGLPVRRFAGERGRVSARTEALAHWRSANLEQPRSAGRPRLVWYVALLAVVVVATGAGWFLSRKGAPAAFRVEFRTLVVTDVQGRELWRREMDDRPGYSAEEALRVGQVWFGDLDGDGHTEFLYAYTPVSVESARLNPVLLLRYRPREMAVHPWQSGVHTG